MKKSTTGKLKPFEKRGAKNPGNEDTPPEKVKGKGDAPKKKGR